MLYNIEVAFIQEWPLRGVPLYFYFTVTFTHT